MNNYTPINWEDNPSTATPITAENLNHMDEGIKAATDGVTATETAIQTLQTNVKQVQTDITGKADKAITLDGYGITDGEKSSNKVSTIDFQTASETQYPNVAGLKDYHENYVATLYDDVDNLSIDKADKATTLAGYGITDAYTKEQVSKYLKNKQDKLGWDTIPKDNSPNAMTSGSIYTALQAKANTADVDSKLALKYDASNVETGSCTLEETDIAYFNTKKIVYEKIGSFVMLSIQLIASSLIEANTSIKLSGLPFVSKMSCSTATYSNKNAEVHLRVTTNYNTLTVTPKVDVSSGSTITATLIHRIA